jgi:ubiquinone/menaquinone biosynthesis C-methylase UbiE
MLHNIIQGAIDRVISYYDSLLNRYGYTISKSGYGYINAKETVRNAQIAGLSICEYLESKEDNPKKSGRRNRIIEKMKSEGLFQNCPSACEIGTGTGMYLEKVLSEAKPSKYEIYETAGDWVEFLKQEYQSHNKNILVLHPANGINLCCTKSNSCDLVHAHAVFVYISLMQIFEYIQDAARVCKPGKYVVFDCFLDTSFDLQSLNAWMNSKWRFPVIIPEKLLLDFTAAHALQLTGRFKEIYGASSIDYLIFKKREPNE